MNNNISVISKENCCGCSACASICPLGAISMSPDSEGFLYPKIDQKLCTDCGACLRVCENNVYHDSEQKIFACCSKDDDLVAKSSSGGIFSVLAEKILDNGGGVCAVGYSDDCKECFHKLITSKYELDDLRRAKFVQSKKYNIYVEIRDFLKTGKILLFCGTPCEVGGLRQFLRKDYENLITADLICGCVSSPKV